MLTIQQAIEIAKIYSRCPAHMRSRLDYIFSKCEDFNFEEFKNFDFKDADEKLMLFVESKFNIEAKGRVSKTVFEEAYLKEYHDIMRKDIKWHMAELGFPLKKYTGHNYYSGISEKGNNKTTDN